MPGGRLESSFFAAFLVGPQMKQPQQFPLKIHHQGTEVIIYDHLVQSRMKSEPERGRQNRRKMEENGTPPWMKNIKYDLSFESTQNFESENRLTRKRVGRAS